MQVQQNHVGEKETGALQATRVVALTSPILCTLTISRGGETLMGYATENGGYSFLIGSEIRSFDTLADVWKAWEKHTDLDG